MNKLDTAKLRSAAQEMQQKSQTFQAKKAKMDEIVNQLVNNWDDNVNKRYAAKYNQEAAPASDDVKRLMDAYVNMLDEVVVKSEEYWRKVESML